MVKSDTVRYNEDIFPRWDPNYDEERSWFGNAIYGIKRALKSIWNVMSWFIEIAMWSVIFGAITLKKLEVI